MIKLDLDVRRRGQVVKSGLLSPIPDYRGGWFSFGTIREAFSGAFQRDIEISPDLATAYSAVYSCITLIAGDVGKLRIKLMQIDADGIWTETTSPAFSPILRKPNSYQNYIQFKEWWITSKLMRGNTYALKVRDSRKVVTELYILDPSRVAVLVAPDGSVFYQLSPDNLSGITEGVVVPAEEIIHDRMNCLFHPLVGVSPIYACGEAANGGLKIQRNAARFFGKGSMPSGVLSAPQKITKETADRLKDHWESQFSGDNAGAVAVLGEGLKWEPMRMTAVDAQLIEQLKWSAETVCSVFHVPPFKIGIGAPPTYANAAASLNMIYYADCLQALIEAFELVIDEGLGIGPDNPIDKKVYSTELDIDALIRMDTATQYKTYGDGIGAGLLSPNEGRKKLDLKPVKGGDSPYLQQQNYSLEALAKRDAKPDPFAARLGVGPEGGASTAQDPANPPNPGSAAPPAPAAPAPKKEAEEWSPLEYEILEADFVPADDLEAEAESVRMLGLVPTPALLGPGTATPTLEIDGALVPGCGPIPTDLP